MKLGVLGLLLLVGAPAIAEDKAVARNHYKNGQTYFNLGRFTEAIAEFEKGYESFPDPAFLFNLGQSHKQLGNRERAIFYYRGYLRDKPNAENRVYVERVLRELEQETPKEVTTAAPQSASDPGPTPTPAPVSEPEPMSVPEPVPAPELTQTAAPAPPTSSLSKTLAWSTVGFGVALLGAGAAFGLQARNAADDANACIDRGGPWPACEEAIDQHDSKASTAVALGAIGAAAAVGGIVWLWLGGEKPAAHVTWRYDVAGGKAIASLSF